MDKYNFENIHDWTYAEICSEADRLADMELSLDKISKLSALEKLSKLYCVVIKTKSLKCENDQINNYFAKYDLKAFFGNNDHKSNLKRLKFLRGKIRTILIEEEIKFGYEMESELKKRELQMNPLGKSRQKLMN